MGVMLIAVLGSIVSKYIRDFMIEFRSFNFLVTAHVNTYKAHFLAEKCFDATLVIVKQIRDIKEATPEKKNAVFLERAEGVCNDVFMQNGLSPKDYKVSKLMEMEMMRRYSNIKLPKEVI